MDSRDIKGARERIMWRLSENEREKNERHWFLQCMMKLNKNKNKKYLSNQHVKIFDNQT